MANALIRGRSAVWGIATESGDTYAGGIVQGQEILRDGEVDYIFDDEGFTITEIFFDDRDECSIDVLCEAATALPERGDDIAIAGVDCIVQSATLKWEKKAWKMLNVKAKKFPNLTEA